MMARAPGLAKVLARVLALALHPNKRSTMELPLRQPARQVLTHPNPIKAQIPLGLTPLAMVTGRKTADVSISDRSTLRDRAQAERDRATPTR